MGLAVELEVDAAFTVLDVGAVVVVVDDTTPLIVSLADARSVLSLLQLDNPAARRTRAAVEMTALIRFRATDTTPPWLGEGT